MNLFKNFFTWKQIITGEVNYVRGDQYLIFNSLQSPFCLTWFIQCIVILPSSQKIYWLTKYLRNYKKLSLKILIAGLNHRYCQLANLVPNFHHGYHLLLKIMFQKGEKHKIWFVLLKVLSSKHLGYYKTMPWILCTCIFLWCWWTLI